MANTGQAGSQDENALIGQLGGAVAPQAASGQVQYNLGQEQLGLVNSNLGQTTAYNNALAGYQGQNLQLSEQGLGISQLGLQQQGAQSQAQQGFEQQQFGLQQQQYPEQQAEAATAYQGALMGQQAGQAIGGTQNTVGGKQQAGALNQSYQFQQADIARAQQESQLGQQAEQSGYGYSQEQLANAQSNLSLNAQANGLSEQQLMTMLNYGNQQTGEGAQQDIISLLANQGNTAAGNLTNEGTTLSQIGQKAGLNALAGIG